MPNTETVEAPALSSKEIVRAATNSPELSESKVKLGDREFTIVDLPYDDYLEFLSFLQPLLESLAGKMAGDALPGLIPDTSSLNAGTLIKYCGTSLPRMVQIVLSQTDPKISVEEIKILGKNPFKLATIVLTQIEQNRIIGDISDFFVQILPFLTAGMKMKKSISK